MATTLILIGAVMLLTSILFSPLSHRVGMPVLLIFLAVGLLAGEDGPGGLAFHDDSLAFLVGNLALAVILLDGGIRTRAESFRVGLKPALALATVGVALTAGMVGLVAWWLFELPLLVALLLGTIVSSTDAAAVFSLLQGRNLHLNERVSATLEIESGTNDPMAIFLTLLLLELITQADGLTAWAALLLLLKQFALGLMLGWLGGRLLAWMIQKIDLVPALYPLLVTALGVTVFAGTNELGGSGFLAIYLTGVVMANRNVRMMPTILQVHDGLAWLAQMSLFLILGLLAAPHEKLNLAIQGLVIAAVLIIVARPLAVVLSLLPFGFRRREVAFISWVGLRGAVPIVLALFPVMAGVGEAHLLFNIAFFVVVLSLLVQGTTLAPLARKLKLEVPHIKEPFRRVPLDLLAVGDHEVFLYPLRGERWKSPVTVRDLRIPDDTQLAGIFREGKLMSPRPTRQLKEDDVAAVIGRPEHLKALGPAFAGKEPPRDLGDRAFFGEFVVHGEATLRDLQDFYGLDLGSDTPNQTLAQAFQQHFGNHPVVGDRLPLGPVTLVARDVEQDRVTRVGLNLH